MKEITYSEDVIIRDPNLLATLAIFCGKIYLPYPNTAHDLHSVLADADIPAFEGFVKSFVDDPEKDLTAQWKEKHALLFQEGILEFLPIHSDPRYHREHDAQVHLSRKGDTRKRSIVTHFILFHHLMRNDLPGLEFFEGGTGTETGAIELSQEIFAIELPSVSANDADICELRLMAQNEDVRQFWEMIEEQVKRSDGTREDYIARAEKICDEATRWRNDNWKFRMGGLVFTGLISLCFLNSVFLAPTGIIAYNWLSEANRRWAERKERENSAFRFVSRVRGAMKKCTN